MGEDQRNAVRALVRRGPMRGTVNWMLDDPQTRAAIAQQIATARVAIAPSIGVDEDTRARLSDAHREEVEAIERAHAALVYAARLFAR